MLTSRADRDIKKRTRRLGIPFPVLAIATLCVAWAEILWGGVVRLSKSGLGCADNWPLCNCKVYPFWEQPVLIEYISHPVPKDRHAASPRIMMPGGAYIHGGFYFGVLSAGLVTRDSTMPMPGAPHGSATACAGTTVVSPRFIEGSGVIGDQSRGGCPRPPIDTISKRWLRP